jgi:hypothetical protein
MQNNLGEFDQLVQSILKNKLQKFGHQFKSQDEFSTFVRENIFIDVPEQSNLQHFYLGKPKKNGVLLFTYKIS